MKVILGSHARYLITTEMLLLAVFMIGMLIGSISSAYASSAQVEKSHQATTDLTELSLEELMNIEVTTVSKKPEKLSDASAAIYVITQEDIRRSGMTSIPELLRMVPGLFVGHIDANKWAISARGFAERYAKKMLVLIDGRTVYTPTFSGVYWDAQGTMLDDIERIEVIRGPGATLWGANAVNGIVNMITKTAGNTQGALIGTTFGDREDKVINNVRYGGMLGDDGHYRIYAKYFGRGSFDDASGHKAADAWHQFRGGFRIDSDLSETDSLTIQGDAYHGEERETLTLPILIPPLSETLIDTIGVGGGNLLARWNHAVSDNSDTKLQFYYDRTKRKNAQLGELRDIWDLDFQHRSKCGMRQEIIWGFGYRYTTDRHDNTFWISFDPPNRNDHLISAFVQCDIKSENRSRLTVGSKFEHNSYTGFEIQPNVRFLWTPGIRDTMWASISRAVRTPSRVEDDARINYDAVVIPGNLPGLVSVFGDRGVKSDELFAYELGWRTNPMDALSVDIAAFYNVYNKVIALRLGESFFESDPTPHIVFPIETGNFESGHTYGLEIAANWSVTSKWRLAAGYEWFEQRLRIKEIDQTSGAVVSRLIEQSYPRNQFHLLSRFDLPNDMEFDAALYGAEGFIPPLSFPRIPGYFRLDLRLGWRPTRDIEASVGVRNVLDDRHPEFAPGLREKATEVPRSVYGKVMWRF